MKQAHAGSVTVRRSSGLSFLTAYNEDPLLDAFEFDHDGLRFSCRIEAATGARKDAWWWFGVSTDDRHRYAPFRADEADTEADIKARVLQYYADLLARRAEPVASHWRRGVRPAPAAVAAPAAEAEPEAEPTTPAEA